MNVWFRLVKYLVLSCLFISEKKKNYYRKKYSQLKAELNKNSSSKRENDSRRLYVDITNLNESDEGTGIQRVSKNILHNLIAHPPCGFDVYPVYWADTRYCFATKYLEKNKLS